MFWFAPIHLLFFYSFREKPHERAIGSVRLVVNIRRLYYTFTLRRFILTALFYPFDSWCSRDWIHDVREIGFIMFERLDSLCSRDWISILIYYISQTTMLQSWVLRYQSIHTYGLLLRRLFIPLILDVREIYVYVSNLSVHVYSSVYSYSTRLRRLLRRSILTAVMPGPLFYHLLVGALIILTYYRLAVLSVSRNRWHIPPRPVL